MNGRLAGNRILVVEDEYFVASDMVRALEKAGAIPVGPVNDVREGLALLDQGIDAAILDVNLVGGRSFALADELAARDVPYVFVTGYDEWALPEAYRDAPRITKPFRIDAVIERMEQLLGDGVVAA